MLYEVITVFQLSADPSDLGRTYETKLSTIGDIKCSLKALLPLLQQSLTEKGFNSAPLLDQAKAYQQTSKIQLQNNVTEQFSFT